MNGGQDFLLETVAPLPTALVLGGLLGLDREARR